MICTLVMAAFKTIEQHSATAWICGFEIALDWSFEGHVANIDVIPMDNKNRAITWNENHHGIRLSPADGIVSRPYPAIFRLKF